MSNRRDFLKKAGGAALLTIVPRSVLGGTNCRPERPGLTKGIIGVGGIGKSSYHFTPPTMHAAWWRSATSTATP